MNGRKKQSSSLSKEQVRLLSIEVITSVTDFLTNTIESYGHTYIHLKYIYTPLPKLFPGVCCLREKLSPTDLQESCEERVELLVMWF